MKNNLFAGVTGVLCAGGAVWYLNEEEKHKTLSNLKHSLKDVEWLQTTNLHCKDDCELVSNNPIRQSIATTELSVPNCKHPETQALLQFTNTNGDAVSSLSVQVRSKNKFYYEIDLLLSNRLLKDTTAYTAAFYDLYPKNRLRVLRSAAASANSWQQALHVIEVSNYWFPASNFTMYISYDFIVDDSDCNRTIFRDLQLDVESVPRLKTATNARRRLQPALSLGTQSPTFTTMQLNLPLRDGRLEIKSLRRPHAFLFLLQFQNENERPNELILLEPVPIAHSKESIQYFPLRIPTGVANANEFVFLQLQCLESGIVKPSWLEEKSFDLDKEFEKKGNTRIFSYSESSIDIKGCLVKRKSVWFLFSRCIGTQGELNEVAFLMNENLDKYVYLHLLHSVTVQITVIRDTLQVSVSVF